MEHPVLYRKRLIPEECVCLKDDEVLYLNFDEGRLVTKWKTIKPRKDISHGYSAYFWNEGFKISKFYNQTGNLIYWYCDIIDVTYPEDRSSLTTTDLLADVLIYPDEFVKVVDLDELTQAFDMGSLSIDMLKASINRLSHLLDLIYSGNIKEYKDFLESFE